MGQDGLTKPILNGGHGGPLIGSRSLAWVYPPPPDPYSPGWTSEGERDEMAGRVLRVHVPYPARRAQTGLTPSASARRPAGR